MYYIQSLMLSICYFMHLAIMNIVNMLLKGRVCVKTGLITPVLLALFCLAVTVITQHNFHGIWIKLANARGIH